MPTKNPSPAKLATRTPATPVLGFPNKLIITEKPSVARDIAKVLNENFTDHKTYLLGNEHVITFALGHLLTIADPQEMDERYKKWGLTNLPIIPNKFLLKPIEKTKAQLTQVKKLILRKEIKEIINACDAGREGELIFKYVIDYVSKSKPLTKKISRLWLQSMTKDSIKKSLLSLRANEELHNLQDAAMSRSEADWLIGINASRGLTGYYSKRGGFFLTPCGRVQTPTLSIIVNKEESIESFIPTDYYRLEANFKSGADSFKGVWFDKNFKKGQLTNPDIREKDDREDRIWDIKKAKEIIKLTEGKEGTFTDKVKSSYENPPLLYDLTTLQREANSLHGFSAKQTLSILQALYEGKKILTYPRTSSKFLPNDYLSTMKGLFTSLASSRFKGTEKYLNMALDKNYIINTARVFNDSKVSDHHAIIPTGAKIPKLSEAEEKIFLLVLRRLIAIFFPACEFLKTTRIVEVKGETFKSNGNVITKLGWKEIYPRKVEEMVLPSLKEATKILADKVELAENITHPPARYTESTLLSAMEGAGKTIDDEALKEAMKNRGLGTPATRAAIIEKLIYDKYIVKEGRELIPTAKAFDLFSHIRAMDLSLISSPELTGDWEFKLNQMEQGKIDRSSFMHGIVESTAVIVKKIKEFDIEKLKQEAKFSPLDGRVFYEYIDKYVSSDGQIAIRKVIGGRRMKEEEVVTLIREKSIGPFSDFRSKKRGSLFSASLILDEENKVKFIFANSDDTEEISLEKDKFIGEFFGDGSKVYQTLNHYTSENYKEKNTGIKISRILLGKEIDETNVKQLLLGEKTSLIKGFRSTKTKRLFDAYLNLTKEGKIEFSFPERKKSKKK